LAKWSSNQPANKQASSGGKKKQEKPKNDKQKKYPEAATLEVQNVSL
jgi:hypothetical protein